MYILILTRSASPRLASPGRTHERNETISRLAHPQLQILWGCLGSFWEPSLGLLGASWAPWRPRNLQEIPRTPPSPPQDGPKKPQMAAKGFQKESPEIPEKPQGAIKTLEK